MRRVALLVATFALAYAVGRHLPVSDRRVPRPAVTSTGAPAGAAGAEQHSSRSVVPAPSRLGVPVILPARPLPPTPWIAHVARDPEHHAMDAQRISQAVFGDETSFLAMHACTPLFPPVESKLRLRTRISITRASIVIDPIESVEVVDGVELSQEARACVLAAFSRSLSALPTFPDHVHPFHGPYELTFSVLGPTIDSAIKGDES